MNALLRLTCPGPGSQNEFAASLERGMPQGAPLSGLLLALATCTPKTDALAKKYGVMILRYVDDISIVGPAEHLAKVYRSFRKELGTAGVLFNPKKGRRCDHPSVITFRRLGRPAFSTFVTRKVFRLSTASQHWEFLLVLMSLYA